MTYKLIYSNLDNLVRLARWDWFESLARANKFRSLKSFKIKPVFFFNSLVFDIERGLDPKTINTMQFDFVKKK